ncbi:phosphoribosylformylglycinamidine synthase subunit PurQ [Bacillus niameyensis]|uniref:phosphoribosylformylglycinamidine synthase subunit PurQ n=1 Tax=Bacillus niameyensis TaxID=1522308 RepID=UPI0007855BF5|nr:phosphoribosylformylglycinamidine synthase subunit PurQ [Bacillus niameyensis]
MKIAIVVFPGTSCEADVRSVIENNLEIPAEYVGHDCNNLDSFDVILLPGGASYGDALRPGAIAARQPVMKAIQEAAEAGKTVLGIGNGFQILLESGLLPGVLLKNSNLKFICKSMKLKVVNNDTMFTANFEEAEVISIPIAHGYGQYYCDRDTLNMLQNNDQIAFTYVSENPGESIENIAGIINQAGNVLGMMPHPERATDLLFGSTDGLRIFQSIVRNRRVSHD